MFHFLERIFYGTITFCLYQILVERKKANRAYMSIPERMEVKPGIRLSIAEASVGEL